MNQLDTLEQAIGRAMELTPRPDSARLEQVLLRLEHPASRTASKPWRTVWPWLMLVSTMAAAAAGHWYYRHAAGGTKAVRMQEVLSGEKSTSPHAVPNKASREAGSASKEPSNPPQPAGNNEQRKADIIYRH